MAKQVIRESIIPVTDNTVELGTDAKRFANIYMHNLYTGDLHLKNERGDWTFIEEEDYLSIVNNKTGKKYRFVLEEVKD